MNKTRVLHILNSLNYGGAEQFLLNLWQNTNKQTIDFDILVRGQPNPMKAEFEKLGATIIEAPSFPRDIISNYKFMTEFVEKYDSEYDWIHIHANSLIYTLPTKIFNHPKILLHSHSSDTTNPVVKILHKINRFFYLKKINKNVACSQSSGHWMFKNKDFETIYNGINVKKFKFNSLARNNLRAELGVKENEILLGSVGRLTKVKNYNFLLKLLKKLEAESQEKTYKLILIGSGGLEEELKQNVELYNISEKVIFTGQRTDVDELLSAMDIYLQPSLFEGMPFTVIEAQVANLPTIVSDVITEEVKISNKLKFASLNDSQDWINWIGKQSEVDQKRMCYQDVNIEKIDIRNVSEKFEQIYSR